MKIYVPPAPSDVTVGKTILEQIRALDYWALGAWGARDAVIFNRPMAIDDGEGGTFQIGERDGGIMFRVRGTRKGYGKSAKIVVGLQFDDTYTVVGGRTHRGRWRTLDVVDDVYFDQLVSVIDSLVG